MSLSLFWMMSSNDAKETADAVRINLEACSASWFSWVKYAGYAVAAGCAMEAPETCIVIKRWWLLRFRGDDSEETIGDRRSWFVPLAAIGLLVIVIGIVVETYAEGKVSDVDAKLRAYESDKITDAEKKLSAAQAKLVWMGTRDAPIYAHQDEFVENLSPFKGQKFVVAICGGQVSLGDQEPIYPAGTISYLLKSVGWKSETSYVFDSSCGAVGYGIGIEERRDAPDSEIRAARELRSLINEAMRQGAYPPIREIPQYFRTVGPDKKTVLYDAETIKILVMKHPPTPTTEN